MEGVEAWQKWELVEEEDPWVKYNTDYVIASFYYWICGGGWFVVGRIRDYILGKNLPWSKNY